jgi:hypothetical protein
VTMNDVTAMRMRKSRRIAQAATNDHSSLNA